jgi:hypothetical protein
MGVIFFFSAAIFSLIVVHFSCGGGQHSFPEIQGEGYGGRKWKKVSQRKFF